MEDKIEILRKYISECNNIVFFGGAGVSTESGIPDFRSKDGLYNQKYDYPPEEILSHTFFINNTEEFYKFYKEYAMNFCRDLGIDTDKLRYHDHDKLAHYAKEACDIEYLFPMGWGELWGTHNRTNYDLRRHQEFSGVSQEYLDPLDNTKYIPYVIESSVGCDRLTLALLCDSYREEDLGDGTTREVMGFIPALAPYKVAILPLVKKYHSEYAKELKEKLSKYFMCTYDETGSIGKRYRRCDAIGVPYCITVDDETFNQGTVTLRDRDTMEQIVLPVEEIEAYVMERIQF